MSPHEIIKFQKWLYEQKIFVSAKVGSAFAKEIINLVFEILDEFLQVELESAGQEMAVYHEN